ncbi:MAG: helix-turn-helix domain-containing protein [Acidobacteria bacterium]|nr:helix-turn-helix domain-containing protein [Acidobacteriota bacterium]
MDTKVIFGVKLKRLREARKLSLTEFAERSHISPSFVNEIERGKKYPKPEKILRMAEVLGVSSDELVSTRLDHDLDPLKRVLDSPLLLDFPFHLFGLSSADVVELITRSPSEVGALITALVSIAEGYDVTVEHFFRAALRAYQEAHENYFEDLERAAARFLRRCRLEDHQPIDQRQLEHVLQTEYGYQIDDQTIATTPQLKHYRSIWLDSHPPRLLINSRLTLPQRKFILAREIGYRFLDLKERAITSAPESVDSFEQVLNDFKASYFAGAVLIHQKNIRDDLRAFLKRPRWSGKAFLQFLSKYEVTPEIFLYRLSEILPRYFGVKLHFLRFNQEGKYFRLVKHLNMSQVIIPGGIELVEHFCRRWLTIELLQKLAERQRQSEKSLDPVMGIQRSQFIDSFASFLCMGFARPLTLSKHSNSSAVIGIRVTPGLEKIINFLNDPSIPSIFINQTCERCRLTPDQCAQRAAPPTILRQQKEHEERERVLAELLEQIGQTEA